ncbi:MAG: hypothetical protein A2W23_10095 [Planctomycetes bacterium RBG_16_43_13]|nr:MAG: hypothetical protein A2W23_10095 [Planctomycetes bacterium RBG_16_43_13]
MVGPIRLGTGLVSGIDYNAIIESLLAVRKYSVLGIENKIANLKQKETALLDVSASLLGFKGSADALSLPSFFAKTNTKSSNENVLFASGNQISTTGAFSFSARRLAQSHQLISNGFADSDVTAIAPTASKITFEIGGGYLEKNTSLSFLNGQAGVNRGFIKITDSSNKTAVIDLQGALTVKDVLDSINSNTQVSVRASATADRIVIEDLAGGSPSNFKVDNYGLDNTASDLGIKGTGVSVGGKTYIFGKDINYITNSTNVSLLNNGLGVRRNSDGINDLAITDRTGLRTEIDIRNSDVTVLSIINRINTTLSGAGNAVRVSLNTDNTALQLVDSSVGIESIAVSGINSSLAPVDLGFGVLSGTTFVQVGAEDTATGLLSATGNRIAGYRLIGGLNSILRNTLNGGMVSTTPTDIHGVRDGSIKITDRDGNNVTLDMSNRIQTTIVTGVLAGATSVSATSIAGFAVGNEIRIVGGGNTQYRTITRISGTTLVFDKPLDVGFSGGQGIYAMNQSLGDIVNAINDRATSSNVDVTASIDNQGNGILISDVSAGTGSLSVSGVGGSFTAADLGIEQTVSDSEIDGSDLDPQWIGENTLLKNLNSGKGVYAGKFKIYDTTGKNFTIDLSQSNDTTIGKAISDINNAAIAALSGVRARINDAGDGIYIEDTTPGSGTLRIEDLFSGSTAKDLNILGTAPSATPSKLDGSFEVTVNISAGSTLDSIASAINSKGISVTASVINDGSETSPYRLSILSRTSGSAGRLTINTDISGLSFDTTTPPQDAILLYGSDSGMTNPVIITSSGNTITDIVKGMTLTLRSASTENVTVTVSKDTQGVTDQVQRFVDTYNAVIDKIGKYAFFNTETLEKGILFTDTSIRDIQRDLANLVNLPVTEVPSGQLNTLQSIGVRIASGGKLSFDSSKLSGALNTKFSEVEQLFTMQKKLKLDTLAKDLNNGRGVTNSAGGTDFKIYLRNATTVLDINVDGVSTIGSLLNSINQAPGNGGKLAATISSDGFSIVLTDSSTPTNRTLEIPASNSTFTESDFAGSYDNDFFNGATVTILDGSNQGEVRTVKDFDKASGLITLESELSSVLTAGTSYKIERNLEAKSTTGVTTAADFGIQKKLALGQNQLIGNILNLKGDPGIGFRISERLDFITRPGEDGLISSRTSSIDDTIKSYDKTIDRINLQLKREEERLIKQFSALESIIAQSQTTISQLQSQLGGILAGFQTAGK